MDCRYPVLSATDVRTSKILLVVVVALHAGFAVAIKILCFAYVAKIISAFQHVLLTSLSHQSPALKDDEPTTGERLLFA